MPFFAGRGRVWAVFLKCQLSVSDIPTGPDKSDTVSVMKHDIKLNFCLKKAKTAGMYMLINILKILKDNVLKF